MMKFNQFLAYLNLPILGLFLWSMATAKENGWSRNYLFGLFFCYALVRVLVNMWIARDKILMMGDMIQTMKKLKNKEKVKQK